MNRKQFGILLVLAVLIGGAGLSYIKRQRASFSTASGPSAGKIFPDFPLNEVTLIRVQGPSGDLNLAKEGEKWIVRERSNYPANFATVGGLIRKVWELKPLEEVKVGASQLARLELLPPGGAETNAVATVLEFKNKEGKSLATLLLGKKYTRPGQSDNSPFGGGGLPAGRYVQTGGASKTFLVNEPFTDADPKADTWLNKDFIRVEKLKAIEVVYPEATNSFAVTRESEAGDWLLSNPAAGEILDKSKVSGFNYALSSPGFNDVLPADAPGDKTGLDTPVVVKLATFDGFDYTLKVGRVDGQDNYHLTLAVAADLPASRLVAADEKPEDKERLDKEFKDKDAKLREKLQKEKALENWVFVVSKWTLDSVLKNRPDLMVAETPPAEGMPATEEDDHNHDVPPIQLLPKELTNIKLPPLPNQAPSAAALTVELAEPAALEPAPPKPEVSPAEPPKEN